MNEKTTCLPVFFSSGEDFRSTGGKRTDTDSHHCRKKYQQRKTAIGNSVVENLNGRTRVTRLTWLEAITRMATSIGPTERRVRFIAANRRYTNGYPEEVGSLDRTAPPWGRLPCYRTIWSRWGGRSDSELRDDEHRQREWRSKLRVLCTLNEVSACPADYRE